MIKIEMSRSVLRTPQITGTSTKKIKGPEILKELKKWKLLKQEVKNRWANEGISICADLKYLPFLT